MSMYASLCNTKIHVLQQRYKDTSTLLYSNDYHRQCMDRRRLEEAHLLFCILNVYKQYPKAFPCGVVSSDLQQTLDDVSPAYYEAFTKKYAG